jgi:hypothetical protein
MNDLLAIEFFLCVLTVLTAVTIGMSFYWDGVHRAQTLVSWNHLRPMQLLWLEENAVTGSAPSDAVAYQRGRAGAAAGATDSEGSALGSIRGLEALRLRAARQDDAGGKDEAKKMEGTATVGLSDGVPTAVMNRPFVRGPVLVEFSDGSPVVSWLCGHERARAGWSAPAVREPQVPDIYLPSICRQRTGQ